MMQTPVNYAMSQVPSGNQTQNGYATTQNPTGYMPVGYQPSYNAVKIDIHNPKVMDAPQGTNCNSQYSMPSVPYYNYPMVPMPWQYPYVPMPTPQTSPQVGTTTPAPTQTTTPAPTQPTQQVPQVPQPVPVVPVVPQTPVQQVVNNGVPTQQTVQQTVPQSAPAVQPETFTNVQTPTTPQTPTTVSPEQTLPTSDVAVVLKGLKSNNMAEQADALSQIGYASQKPDEIKKYLETGVLDALLDILKTDISGLATATPAQIEARTKMVNEKPITEEEKNLAQTYAPQEFAILNKQNALYSIAVIQKALADEIEKAGGKKLSIEELPAINQVVDTVKSNPSPELRGSAIVALAHLNKPEYKPVLQEIFELAQKDQDPNVKDVATEALKKINE